MQTLIPESTEPPLDGDAAVMDALAAGDPAALRALVEGHWAELVRYVRRLLDDRDAAEDVVQEAFLRLWEERARWWAATVPRAVLYRIARNLALNEIKATAGRDRRLRRLGPPRPVQTPMQLLECKELRRAMRHAVRRLPPRRRTIFVLARVRGLSYREIGATLQIAPQTVANQMSAALATLAGALSPFLEGSAPGRPLSASSGRGGDRAGARRARPRRAAGCAAGAAW